MRDVYYSRETREIKQGDRVAYVGGSTPEIMDATVYAVYGRVSIVDNLDPDNGRQNVSPLNLRFLQRGEDNPWVKS